MVILKQIQNIVILEFQPKEEFASSSNSHHPKKFFNQTVLSYEMLLWAPPPFSTSRPTSHLVSKTRSYPRLNIQPGWWQDRLSGAQASALLLAEDNHHNNTDNNSIVQLWREQSNWRCSAFACRPPLHPLHWGQKETGPVDTRSKSSVCQ